jgi:hypothetical protein
VPAQESFARAPSTVPACWGGVSEPFWGPLARRRGRTLALGLCTRAPSGRRPAGDRADRPRPHRATLAHGIPSLGPCLAGAPARGLPAPWMRRRRGTALGVTRAAAGGLHARMAARVAELPGERARRSCPDWSRGRGPRYHRGRRPRLAGPPAGEPRLVAAPAPGPCSPRVPAGSACLRAAWGRRDHAPLGPGPPGLGAASSQGRRRLAPGLDRRARALRRSPGRGRPRAAAEGSPASTEVLRRTRPSPGGSPAPPGQSRARSPSRPGRKPRACSHQGPVAAATG